MPSSSTANTLPWLTSWSRSRTSIRRRLWEALGYASLFSFLRRELRLSAGAAQYRKTAAELVQKFPDVEAALRDGRLCLSSVIEMGKVITTENAAEILPRFFGLSSRDAAFVAASIRPVENPPARDFLVTPVRGGGAATINAGLEATPSTSAAPMTDLFRAPEVAAPGRVASSPAAPTPAVPAAPVPAATSIEPLDGERARLHMTVSRRLLEKLEAARDALSHSHPGASRDEIIEAGLDLLLERAAKRRGLVKNPRKHTREPKPDALRNDRYVTAEVRRVIWERDQGKCQWELEGGGICGSTCRPELDHIQPYAKGGRITKPEEGRLLCKPHNRRYAREVFGDAWMGQFTRKRPAPLPDPLPR